jgi:hypothetical protein
MDKDDKTICDRCDNYHCHPSGLTERCTMVKNEPFSRFTDWYAEPRMAGESKSCKGFRRLSKC